MTTHQTLEEARQAAAQDPRIGAIVEIEHEEHGRCYIKIIGTLAGLQDAIRRSGKPLPGIVQYIAEHPVKTAEQIEAERVAYLRDNTHCHRCATQIDGNTAYSRQEWSRIGGTRLQVATHYCGTCAQIVRAFGDYAEDPAEPYTKRDW